MVRSCPIIVPLFPKIMFAAMLLLGEPATAASFLRPVSDGAVEGRRGGSTSEGGSDRKPPSDSQRVSPGTWGGEHVRLEVTENGAEIEFDCAHGSAETPIRLDAQGRFAVGGAFVRETPGPIRVGFEPKARPASYWGAVHGKTMTLHVRLTDSDETVGTYTLELGSPGRIRKCR
jgi:hypothetical protein